MPAAPNLADPRTGSQVGKYKIERLLGKGGMGAVYAARHVELARRVAIKFMLPQHAADARWLKRFENEARAAGGLAHANVVAVTDLGRATDGSPYLVMEFLEGEDCEKLVRRVGPLPVARAADLVAQACRGLAAAHAAGLVHRDIKPENLFVTRAGNGSDWLKVLDFGIAKLLDPDVDALTHSGVVFGTARYMSPEQCHGQTEVDERSDVWSLGVVLYQLLSGKRPFDGRHSLEIAYQIQHANPVPLTEYRADLPKALIDLVAHALHKEAAERLPSASAFAAALTPFLADASKPVADRLINPTRSELGLGSASPVAGADKSVAAPLNPAAVVDALELHADRRRARVPTVSLLRGTLASARARFFEWADGARLEVNVARVEDGSDLLSLWLAASCSAGLRARAISVVAAAAQVSEAHVNTLLNSESRDKKVVFLRAAECGELHAFACWVLGHYSHPPKDKLTAFGSLVAGVPGQCWLVLVDEPSDHAAGQLRHLARLVEHFPALTVGVALTEAAFDVLFAQSPVRWQAVLLEGLIRVPSAHHAPAPAGLSAAVRAARNDLILRGISPESLREFDAIATGGAAGKARSVDETFLYSILAEHVETCGWFVLNRTLGFKFGRKPAEIDICSARLRIAIEVDGGFHRTTEARERDQRKDDLLRQNGFTVLRVPSEHLSTNLTWVLDQILTIVREKKRKLWEIPS